ncbi:MAG TPA: hypothetical protein VIL35_17525 [Vicinamibacterales bacterium]
MPDNDSIREAVPPEPNSPDEAGENVAVTPRTGRAREERVAPDSSGIPVDDERRGEQRRRDADQGATEISEMD